MTILVTGSSGHLGEALMRRLRGASRSATGLDVRPGPLTDLVGSITDPAIVGRAMGGVSIVLHTATLHKPHVETHSRQAFIDTNVTGTLTLLEAAVSARSVKAFVFTSTTSAFGAALSRSPGAPAGWIDEQTTPIPRNIYGVSKVAAEDVCQLFHRLYGLPCVVLRVSRFFPEPDDNAAVRNSFADENAKANEFLYRRVDIEDAVNAHLCAAERASGLGFAKYIISATTPFTREDLADLGTNPAFVAERRVPGTAAVYASRDYRHFASIDRVYDNTKARTELGWRPHHSFATVLAQLARQAPIGSALSHQVGSKGYHATEFEEGPYPVA